MPQDPAARRGGGGARSRDWRWPAAVLAICVLHVALLAPLISRDSFILDNVFRDDAVAVLDGQRPYADRDFEYPPLALPVLVAPAIGEGDPVDYRRAFGWEMIGFDLAIVVLLGLAWRRPVGERLAAIGVYSAGLVILAEVGLRSSGLEPAALPLARFDLVPAALVLAAALARESARSATWGALLGVATAVKAFPAALFLPFAQGEGRLGRVALAAVAPLVVAAGLVLVLGDEFGSAITYHAGRDLQVESVAASPLLIAHELGASAHTAFGAGSFNLEATGADAAKLLTLIALCLAYVAIVIRAWRVRAAPLASASAVLAAIVVFAPVLSPQFMLWILPISAAAFGLGLENLVLIAAVVATRLIVDEYASVFDLGDGFVWAIVARNALLLVYLALAVAGMKSRRAAPS